MRKNTRFRPTAYLLIAILMSGMVTPLAHAATDPSDRETPRPIVQKQGFLAYFLSLFFPQDRLEGTNLLQKRRTNDTSTITTTEPTPSPVPEPQTTESGGEEGNGEGSGALDPSG